MLTLTKANRAIISPSFPSPIFYFFLLIIIIIIIIIVYPLTARVVGVLQIISQLVFSIFLCSPPPSGTWWTSRPVHSLMLSSHLFLCQPCLLPLFTVPCKTVLVRPDERETWPYHCSLRLFTIVRSSCDPIACWILNGLPRCLHRLCMRCLVSCGSTSFPWLVLFFGALLWGPMIHRHTGRWMRQGSASVVYWN